MVGWLVSAAVVQISGLGWRKVGEFSTSMMIAFTPSACSFVISLSSCPHEGALALDGNMTCN